MTKEQIDAVLESVRTWPKEDQEELAEVARDIAARRSGVYHATEDEISALRGAEASGLASSEEVEDALRLFRRT